MKIGILFNCQHSGIAASLRHLLPGHEVVNYRFADVSTSEQAADEAAAVLRRCDAVVTTTTGTRLHAADPAALAASGVTILKIPHLVFGGFHPDSCYSPDPAHGIPGPTERFHSRIAACGFLAGLDIEDTTALYNKLAFARLGYFDQFAAQRAVMIEQWAGYGIDLAPWFSRWMERGCFMHSMNHPKIIALHGVAHIVCDKLGVAPNAVSEALPPDPMTIYASHPVYDDIAEWLGVAGETWFRPANSGEEPIPRMHLHRFLTRSFAAFAGAPRSKVRALGGVLEAVRALELE